MEPELDAEAGVVGPTLTVGPTSGGMVRILVEDGGSEIPLDFEPHEAEEIAHELQAAAARARGALRARDGRGAAGRNGAGARAAGREEGR